MYCWSDESFVSPCPNIRNSPNVRHIGTFPDGFIRCVTVVLAHILLPLSYGRCLGLPRLLSMALVTRPFAQIPALDEIARADKHNVADWERTTSLVIGGGLGLAGLILRNKTGLLLGLIGGALLYRGKSGQCEIYKQLGINTARPHAERGVPGNQGINIEASEYIERPADQLFRFWRQLSNLPQFMPHLISVDEVAEGISRWKVRGPLGYEMEWESEIIEEKPNRMLAWQTLPGAEVSSAGSVWFEPESHGTNVKVSLQYDPPAGRAGAVLAKILGASPKAQIATDLVRFKELMEAQP